MSDIPKILLIGGGQAGGQALRRLTASEAQIVITFVTDEAHAPYERPPLSKAFLKGEVDYEQLRIVEPEVLNDPRVTTLLAETLTQIDPDAQTATFASGKVLNYDKLILALGARARPLPIEGAEHCMELRNLADSENLREKLKAAKRLTIIGGGVIGLEVAATARLMGCQVTVIEASSTVMGRILPPTVSAWLQQMHEDKGTQFLMGAALQKIEKTNSGMISYLTLANGTKEKLHSDLILSAIGVVPNVEALPS